jgi:hypothetical protein
MDMDEEVVLGHAPHFFGGQSVRYGDNEAIVDYVILRKGTLHVRLMAHVNPVPGEKLHAPMVPIVWRRSPQ